MINAKALSTRIGMNQSLLAQYISGNKKPSTLQRKRILQGVQQIGCELSEIQFLPYAIEIYLFLHKQKSHLHSVGFLN
jgi:hypothetical protein